MSKIQFLTTFAALALIGCILASEPDQSLPVSPRQAGDTTDVDTCTYPVCYPDPKPPRPN